MTKAPRGVTTPVGNQAATIANLARRLTQLERVSRREWTYRGDWAAGDYQFNDVVRRTINGNDGLPGTTTYVCRDIDGCSLDPDADPAESEWEAIASTAGSIPIGGMIAGPWTGSSVIRTFAGGKFLQVRAQTLTNGATDYPTLAALYPGWVSGSNLIIPSSSLRTFQFIHGGTPGSVGGANTITLATANLPSHSHTGPSHSHTGPSHNHSTNIDTFNSGARGDVYNGTVGLNTGLGNTATLPSILNDTNDHTHSINPPAKTSTNSGTGNTGNSGTGNTGNTGSGTAISYFPQYVSMRLWVRAA